MLENLNRREEEFMLHCERCKIEIRTDHGCCPLCHGGLSGTVRKEDAIFPSIPPKKERQITFLSMLTFCCVLAFIFSYVVNHIITPQNKWFIYVTGGAFFVWIAAAWGRSKIRNLLKNTIWQVFILGIEMGICDVFIGWKGWSVDFGLPALIGASMIFNLILTMIKKFPASEYMIYLLMNGILGLLPLLFIQVHLVKVILPSMICSGLAMILLASLVIFKWQQVINELEKNFHM